METGEREVGGGDSDGRPELPAWRWEQRSFLLRLWRSGDGAWRASLETIPGGERHVFAEVASLLDFLSDRPPDRR